MNKYLYKNKMNIVLYFIIAIVTYISVTFIYNMYGTITNVINENDYNGAKNVVVMSILVLIVLMITLMINSHINRSILKNITVSLREDILNKIYSLDYAHFSKNSISYYASMIVNDVDVLEDAYFSKIIEFISDIIQLFVMLFAITLIGWKYTLIVCLFAALTAIQPYVLKKKLALAGAKQSSQMEKYTGKVNELIKGFSTIKGTGKDNVFMNIFYNNSLMLENSKNNLFKIKAMNALLALIAVNFLRVGGQLFFAYSSVNKIIVASTVAVLMGLINNISNPISQLLSYIEPINSTNEIRKKIIQFMDETCEKNHGENYIGEFEKINMESITFSYNEGEKKVLNNLSLEFEKGKKYALLGESGCGKSTILKLLMGYYNNYDGNIYLNGKELKNINKNVIRDNISYITQNSFIFDDTIENNLTFGNVKYNNADIQKVIKMVSLDKVVKQCEDTSNISKLSGGEKQRIALARAILKDSNLILMDEGTSALDSLIALNIEKNILGNREKTVIAVLHKFNESIKMYDVIYYLKDGEVKEAGSYEELMNLRGDFYRNIIGGGNN